VREPQATFSTCFGAPFMPRHPTVYAAMLRERLARDGAACWLVNTGWSGGAYGTGRRISIAHTRALLQPGVPGEILQPRNAWADKRAYDRTAREVARRFEKNFAQFAGAVEERVRAAGIKAAA
jgi:phosphoenolpyruvate carboxykinase (ATP)